MTTQGAPLARIEAFSAKDIWMDEAMEQAKAPRLVEVTLQPAHRISIDAPTPTPAERAAVADKLARLREAQRR